MAEDADFIPSASFAGARVGYFFKRGAKGLGYYKDGGVGKSSLTESSFSATTDVDDDNDGPALTTDLFDWYRRRLLQSIGARRDPLVDTQDVTVRVLSLWPHGVVGVVGDDGDEKQSGDENQSKNQSKNQSSTIDDSKQSIAIRCDVGVSVEWRAVVTLGDSDSVLGSVTGRIKIQSALLGSSGTVKVSKPELLLGGDKSQVEAERDAKREKQRLDQRKEMEAEALDNNPELADKMRVLSTEEHETHPEYQPMVFADGVNLDSKVREAMRDVGVRRVTQRFAQVVAECIEHLSGGEVGEVDVDASWDAIRGGGDVSTLTTTEETTEDSSADTRLQATRDSDLPASTLAMLRPKTLDTVLEALRGCHGPTGGESTVSLARQEVRPTHFTSEFLPALERCKSSDAPKVLDLSFCGLKDAEAQRLVSVLASGVAPGLTELKLTGNEELTVVTDAMLKGLAMMRKGVKVVR